MHTQHDNDGAERAKEDGQQPGSIVLDDRQHGFQTHTDQIAQRTHHAVDQRSHDEQGEHGAEEELDDLGGDLIRKLLHPGSHIDDHDYRDDGRSVGCQSDRQEAEHGHRLLCRHQCGVVGMDHHKAQGHAQHRVHAEPLGRGVGQHQR